jgi:thiamine biosynthesis lipoprotein
LVLAALFLLISSWTEQLTAQEEYVPVEEARFLMGTLARATAWGVSEGEASTAVTAALDEMVRIEMVLSTWIPQSELSRLNNREKKGASGEISPDLSRVLAAALNLAEASEGAFDPTVLPLVELWGFREEGPVLAPPDALIRATMTQVGYHLVELDPDSTTMRFLSPEVRLDFGGIAKGYALDRAARAMLEKGAVAGRLDLGGEILVFGNLAASEVGIVDPCGGEDPLGTIQLADAAVATSGQYERFREDGAQRWGHILDPRTGYPCRNLMSVTVVAENAMLADAAATACFVLGRERGQSFLESLPWCEGVIVYPGPEGRPAVSFTSGLR